MDIKCLFVILLVIATVAPLKVTPHNRLEKGILKMIENWSNGYYWEIPIAVPRLPLKMAPAHLENDEYTFSSSEITMYGLDEISVQKLTAYPSTYQTYIKINIPSVRGYADWYHLKSGSFVDNEGLFSFTITDLRIPALIDFAARGSNTDIVNFQMSYGYSSIKVNLSGAWWYVENTVNEKIRELMKEKRYDITEHVKNEVVNKTISFLQGYTPRQLVQMISSD